MTCILGPDVERSHEAQTVVHAGSWQGARLLPGTRPGARGWALFGCVLAPAWDKREFELGDRESLLREFPGHAAIIRALTR
jgi:predicted cupin superfamily sugar epimerase